MDVGNVDKPLPSPLLPPSPGDTNNLLVPDVLGSIGDIPPSPASATFTSDVKQKKANPLVDLIDTEKAYVDLLAGIIRKVAAAWSRSNLPPKDLDTMFRSIEAVYKANRSLYSKLKEVGTNPSNPKALGDLLMRWIDDLNSPYTTYCTKFRCGFDTWEPVQSNPKLANVLSSFSVSNPPPPSAAASHEIEPPTWTLDDLFLLPKSRLKYYKKLYGRLLKSTAPGRSDYRLLVGALETLDTLLATLESRSSIIVGELSSGSSLLNQLTEDDAIPDSRQPAPAMSPPRPLAREESHPNPIPSDDSTLPPTPPEITTHRVNKSEALNEERSDSPTRTSTSTLSMPVSNLERRLTTQRTLDIFTMQPKTVRLQMAPPSLTFTRELRYSGDVTISFTPQATGIEIVHALGHIFLLSDLFLICERIAPEDRSQLESDSFDMWLCYPPLSGKVLRISDVPEQPNAFRVAIMRKEHLTIETSSIGLRHKIMAHFKECIDFAASLPPPSKQPPPPVPPLNVNALPGMNTMTSVPQRPPLVNTMPNRHMSMSPPSTRSPSPRSQYHSPADPSPMQGLPGLPFSSEATLQPGAQRTLSPQNTVTTVPPRAASTVPQVSNDMPPARPSQTLPFNPRDLRGSLSPPPRAGYHPSMGPNMAGPPMPPRILSPGPPRPNSAFSQQLQYKGPSHAIQEALPGQIPFPNNSHIQQHAFPTRPNYLAQHPPVPGFPPRPPSEPGRLRSSISTRSLASQYSEGQHGRAPPVPPPFPGGHLPPNGQMFGGMPRSNSFGSMHAPRPVLPSASAARSSSIEPSFTEPSPPNSPVQETPIHLGPVISTVSATMKCKVFLQQQHAQWKSLGAAKLKLYRQSPTNVKQLVVEADDKNHSVLISTIVLTDGVERVGKTGVAIELSDNGQRTGIVYMIQLRNEKSAGGLFDSLLEGSDRGTVL